MEEFKYLPPKYSYAMKDLASDFGVFERADVSSVISGSTNMSMTTASGFNVNFNNSYKDDTSSMFKEKDITSFPLSPIMEQRGPSLQTLKHGSSNSGAGHSLKKYGSTISNNSAQKSYSNGPQQRFRNPVYNELMGPPGVNGGMGPSSMSKQSKRSLNNKRVSPMRERGLDTSQQMMNYNIQPGSGAARIMNASYGNGAGGPGKFPIQGNPMNRTTYVDPQMRSTGNSINSSGFMSDDNRQVQKRKVQVVNG